MSKNANETTHDPASRRLFERTTAPHFNALLVRARNLTQGATDAEDLVQDTLVRAFRFWHTFEPGTNARSWLFTIMRNVFLNQCKAHSRRMERHEAHKADTEALGTAYLPGPADSYEDLETAQRVREAIEKLPEAYRDAVRLTDLEGLSYKETADSLGCPIGSVMSRLNRGRKKLAELLAA